MTSHYSSLAPLAGRDLAEYGVVRVRDQAFDAVQRLWRKRRDAGATQKALADVINRDPGWVSKNLRAPGNWTLRTIGELVQALNGEIEIKVSGVEEAVDDPSNFDAYAEYVSALPTGDVNYTGTISTSSNPHMTIGMNNYSISIKGSPT
jgi:hypothetical protein